VRDQLRVQVERNAAPIGVADVVAPAAVGQVRVAGVQVYQSDAIVRRAASLQRTRDARSPRVVYGAGAES
jgi:NADH-quinone oxidoreductase subunit G